MSLTLGRQGGIAQPLKKRTVGQTNIAHVYDGDNTDSGAECVMFNIESMIGLEDKMPDIMKMNLCANWLGSLSRGHRIYQY